MRDIVADTLSRYIISLADHLGLHDSNLPDDIYPLPYKHIPTCHIYTNVKQLTTCQKTDTLKTTKKSKKKIKQKAPNYQLHSFHGGRKMKSYLL